MVDTLLTKISNGGGTEQNSDEAVLWGLEIGGKG
jgi:hypothetical protein